MASFVSNFTFSLFRFICLLGGGKVQDMVSLCMPGCPFTPFVYQAVLELGDLPASASLVVGLKVGATTAQQIHLFLIIALP